MKGLRRYAPLPRPFAQMARWTNRLGVTRPTTIADTQACVSFCFDDFPKTAAVMGAHILEQAGARGTYYACAGLAGGIGAHGPLFDAHDLRRLAAHGHEIGCHTKLHLNCAVASIEMIQDELRGNRRAIQALGFEQELTHFAYPYGDCLPHARKATSSYFQTMRGIVEGINVGTVDAAHLYAVTLKPGDEGRIEASEWIDRLAETGGWLIFFTHEVEETPTQWGMRPDDLSFAITRAKAAGLEILPVGEAFAAMSDDALSPTQQAQTDV